MLQISYEKGKSLVQASWAVSVVSIVGLFTYLVVLVSATAFGIGNHNTVVEFSVSIVGLVLLFVLTMGSSVNLGLMLAQGLRYLDIIKQDLTFKHHMLFIGAFKLVVFLMWIWILPSVSADIFY